MASCQTTRWVSTAPYIKLTVTQSASTDTTATLSWKLQYISDSAASTSVAKSYSVVIAGTTVKSGTYSINGKAGTYTIASGTKVITKTTSAQTIKFSCSMAFNLTWSGTYGGTKSASGSISVAKKTSYTVSYNANGGSGAPSSQTKWHGTSLTLSTTKPKKTGHTFQGWGTTSTDTSVNYAAGASYASNASIILYAIWKANTYTVKYNANGGSGAPSNQTKTYGKTLTLSSTKPKKTGHTFQGWGTSSSDTSVNYAAGASYTTNANITLYAIWKANTYTVSYNANDGSGAPSSQTKTYGVTLKLSSTIPTRTNYTFKGWGTSASTTTVSYAAGANYTTNSKITLYAVWELNYTKPRITKLTVSRCDADKTPSDLGTYALVTFNWATDREASSMAIEYKLSSESTWANSIPITPYGKTGSVSRLIGGSFTTDNTYDIRVRVSDTDGTNIVYGLLTGTKYVLDILAQGKGIAFGKPAELEDTMDVAWNIAHHGDSTFDNKKIIQGTKPDGTVREAFNPQNGNGNTVIGYGNYVNKDGDTNIYGNDVNIGVSSLATSDYYRPYRRKDDAITMSLRTAGYVTNSGKDISFFVPFAMPIIGSPTITVSSVNGFVLRQGSAYTHGSTASSYTIPKSYSATLVSWAMGVHITATFEDTTNVTNNDAIGIYWSGTITFS